MIITFCGHSEYKCGEKGNSLLYEILEEKIKNEPTCKFYLGGYGYFNSLCFDVLKDLQKTYKDIELLYITPYLDKRLELVKLEYDGIIYPPLEYVPKKFAIIRRNEWMVDNSDYLIAFVRLSWGGAAKMLEYAKRKKKPFINLAE